MRHLVFDVNVLLDAFLCRGESGQAEKLLERVAEEKITGWIAAQSLAVLEYVLRRILKEEGASGEEAQAIAQGFMGWVRQHLSVLTLPGEESRLACGGDLEDIQIALAARALGDEAWVVTNDKKFSVTEGVRRLTVEDAWKLLEGIPPEHPIDFIDLKEQQRHILPRVEQNIRTVLHHGQYIMGPEIKQLEERLAEYVGVKHCITVSDGTKALLIAMMALGIKPGDEVITTPFTFIATGEMIALLGAIPVFVDIDPRTYNIAPNKIEAAITPKTKAIVPVSLYGQCADFDAINAIAGKHGLPVIEDGAQSFGAAYKGRKSCGLSTIGSTSFFPSKPLGCYGDGGALFTNDDALAKIMREIRVHGQDRRYHHPIIGINGRMDTLQAAIVLTKLDVFDKEVRARAEIGTRYTEQLNSPLPPAGEGLGERGKLPRPTGEIWGGGVAGGLNAKIVAPYIEPYNISVYAQYTVLVENREAVQKRLNAAGIPTAVHYPIPLNLQPAFAHLNKPAGSFSVAEEMAKRVISLPMGPTLTAEQQDKIVFTLLHG